MHSRALVKPCCKATEQQGKELLPCSGPPSQAENTGPGFLPTSRTNGKKNQRFKKKKLNTEKNSDSYISCIQYQAEAGGVQEAGVQSREVTQICPPQTPSPKGANRDSAKPSAAGVPGRGLYAPIVLPQDQARHTQTPDT